MTPRLRDLSDEEREEELERQRAVARRRQGTKPPYDRIERALAWAREEWPSAKDYRPVWYSGSIYVEVWTDRGGQVQLFPE